MLLDFVYASPNFTFVGEVQWPLDVASQKVCDTDLVGRAAVKFPLNGTTSTIEVGLFVAVFRCPDPGDPIIFATGIWHLSL